MLRITMSKASAAQVKNYYIHSSSQEAYYSEGQDFNGMWVGKGAARLGLTGSLQEGAFSRLCDNLHPLSGEQLTPRMNGNRRVGYDVNFHVPKSVSLAYFYSHDERILQTIRQAAYDTLVQMEALAATRVRKGGKDEDRLTREIVAAEFVHLTARPVGGVPDPLAHVHCFVFNATYDGQEGAWKALQFGWVKEEADHYQKAFHARLSTGLKALGLHIENNEFAFEVGGVERELIEKFSRRTEVIHAEAVRRGVSDAAELDKLGALTRERKVQDIPLSELEPIWWARFSPAEQQVLESIKETLRRGREKTAVPEEACVRSSEWLGSRNITPRGQPRAGAVTHSRPKNWLTRPVEAKPKEPVEPSKDDLRAVKFAVEHIFERLSVVTEKQLIAEAFRSWCYGKATLEGVTAAVRSWPLIRVEDGHRTMITTREVLEEERRIVERCKAGRGNYPYINPHWKIESQELNEQQRAAVYHVLRSPDFVTGISGKAGTGKTTLLHEARQGIRASGRMLWVFAPTAEAARGTLRSQGFGEAETVAQLLSSEGLQREAAGGVWWVDEAGLLSSRSMDRLLTLADKLNARVVLVGDAGQHHAVERGQAFDLMRKFGDLAVAEVNEVQRQKGSYKRAVELISAKRFEAGFAVLEEMGAMYEMEVQAQREREVARQYVEACEREESALVICPTHEEGRRVTQAIRHELNERNALGEGHKWHILRNLSWTEAQRRDAQHYERGLVVEVTGHLKGFSVGERLEVVGINENRVSLRGVEGQTKELPLAHPERFNVFQRDAIEVCAGDWLRMTANGRSADRHPLTNGGRYQVRDFTADGQMVLSNGWHLGKDSAHLDYGYVPTSHAAQSKTVDWVFVVQSAELSAGATDANQFYVSVSRGRKGVKIYTDSVELLRENVARSRERPMAMEMMREEKAAKEVPPMSASALLGQEAQVKEPEQAQALRQAAVPKPQVTTEVSDKQRLAQRLDAQKELCHEAAEAVERMARKREQKREEEMVMEMG